MFGWLARLWRSTFGGKSHRSQPDDHVLLQPCRPIREPRRVRHQVAVYFGEGNPPPMHWKSCHPRTRARFKAHMTCSRGHAIVLSGHSISSEGAVRPSVVCRTEGCDFHDWVELKDWTDGALTKRASGQAARTSSAPQSVSGESSVPMSSKA